MTANREAAVCAAAGQLRTARHLSEISDLCALSPRRVAPHARRLGFVERVLSSTAPHDADLQDWLRAWALARLIASPMIAVIGVSGAAARVGTWGGSLLHLLDAAAVEAEHMSSGPMIELHAHIDASASGIFVRLDCGSAQQKAALRPEAVRLAALAGLPAVWRRDGEHLCFVVAMEAAPPADPSP